MEWITHRGKAFPKGVPRNHHWYDVGSGTTWVYPDLMEGDTVLFYEQPRGPNGRLVPIGRIVWSTIVDTVRVKSYASKVDLARMIGHEEQLLMPDGYFRDAPEKGLCMMWSVSQLRRENKPRPPEVGWPYYGGKQKGRHWIQVVKRNPAIWSWVHGADG